MRARRGQYHWAAVNLPFDPANDLPVESQGDRRVACLDRYVRRAPASPCEGMFAVELNDLKRLARHIDLELAFRVPCDPT